MWIQFIGYMITGGAKSTILRFDIDGMFECCRMHSAGSPRIRAIRDDQVMIMMIMMILMIMMMMTRCLSTGTPLVTLLRPSQQWGPNHYQEVTT